MSYHRVEAYHRVDNDLLCGHTLYLLNDVFTYTLIRNYLRDIYSIYYSYILLFLYIIYYLFLYIINL